MKKILWFSLIGKKKKEKSKKNSAEEIEEEKKMLKKKNFSFDWWSPRWWQGKLIKFKFKNRIDEKQTQA